MTYHLNEIFSSIQGEGRHAGRPATFIRFASCNLACPWCDTSNKARMALRLDDILAKVTKYGNKSVIITGGEPTIQPGLELLLVALKNSGRWIALETNGLVKPPHADLFDYIATSPKADYAPRYIEKKMIDRADEVRIVATSEKIGAFCRRMRGKIAATDYYVSPLEKDGKMHYRRAFNLMTLLNNADPDLSPPWALSVQLHKILGVK